MKDNIRILLMQAKEGDESAFTQIFELYQNSVYIKARNIMQNEANAQEVVQETFIIVHRNLHQLQDLDSFYSWLMQITISRCHMQFRKEKHYKDRVYDDHMMNYQETRVYLDPQKHMQKQTEQEFLLQMINLLDPKKAEVIKLAYLNELRMDEIAELLNINVNTVKTRAKRGKEELAKLIQEFEAREHKKLNIHVDMILPTTFFMEATHLGILGSFIQKFTNSLHYLQQHMIMSGCAISFSVLVTSGTVFLYEDYQSTQQRDEIVQTQSQGNVSQKDSIKKEEDASLKQNANAVTFIPVNYENEIIHTAREAYFSCLIFAETIEQLETKEKDEFFEIMPVYEALKQSNSPYYERLKEAGWVEAFERKSVYI